MNNTISGAARQVPVRFDKVRKYFGSVSVLEDFDLEIARTRQNEKLMAFLEERARQPATIPLEEIERELGLTGPGASEDSTEDLS